jgi:hypothetical protein
MVVLPLVRIETPPPPCLLPSRRRAAPTHHRLWDLARWVHCTTVSRVMKTCSGLDPCSLATGHALHRAKFARAVLELQQYTLYAVRGRDPVGWPSS